MHTDTHTLQESAELLRMVLPLMSKYKIPVTPLNYAVWYEYTTGRNQLLNERLDKCIGAGIEINEALTAALHREHLDLAIELGQLERSRQLFTTIHENVSQALEKACGRTTEYGDTLNDYQNRIQYGMNADQLNTLIVDLDISTNQMLINNRHLLKDLDESREEVTALKKQLLDARRIVKTDSLTALANRKAFFDEVEEMIREGKFSEGHHSMLMLDIDHFKKVNDTFGHLFGDKVIKAVAMVLKRNTKGKDLAARFGGEEFIVLLPDTCIAGARVVAETIRRTIELASIINPTNKEVVSKVTVSIGITEFREDDDIESVVHRADKALYAAKNHGRNRVAKASPEELTVFGHNADAGTHTLDQAV